MTGSVFKKEDHRESHTKELEMFGQIRRERLFKKVTIFQTHNGHFDLARIRNKRVLNSLNLVPGFMPPAHLNQHKSSSVVFF